MLSELLGVRVCRLRSDESGVYPTLHRVHDSRCCVMLACLMSIRFRPNARRTPGKLLAEHSVPGLLARQRLISFNVLVLMFWDLNDVSILTNM